jgi:hypothetical protein
VLNISRKTLAGELRGGGQLSIVSGKYLELLLFLVTLAAVLYPLWLAIKGRKFLLRVLPQIEAISDGVDRAVESGKPVYISPGDQSYLSGQYAGMTLAGMNVLRYTARMAVEKGAAVTFPVPTTPESLPLIDGVYREVCVAAGKPEAYRRENVVYFGTEYVGHSVAVSAMIERQGCALYVEVGAITGGGSAVPLLWAREMGGVIVAGTARYVNNGFMAVYADYPLFQEDIFAAGAYCSNDEVVKSSQVGGDLIKIFVIGMTLALTILAFGGQPVLNWLKL